MPLTITDDVGHEITIFVRPLLQRDAMYKLVFYAKTVLLNKTKDNLLYFYRRVCFAHMCRATRKYRWLLPISVRTR